MKNFVLLLLITGFCACKKGHRADCFISTGSDVLEERTLPDFSEIALEDNINLVVTQGAVNSVTLKAGEGLMEGIETEVENGVLSIRNTNRCNLARSLKRKITAYVTFKKISRIFFNGSGDISSTNTITDSLFRLDTQNGAGKVDLQLDVKLLIVAQSTGPSDINLSGKTKDSFIYSAGNGFIHMENIESGYVSIISKSTGDCYVWATDLLDVKLFYQGDIYYKGSPVVREPQLTGQGELKPL